MAQPDVDAPAIALGGYPAKRCPRATHNQFSPAAPPKPPPSAETQALFDAGEDFESRVTAELVALLGSNALVVPGDWNPGATVQAMLKGVPVIINGRLPRVGGRVGAPDVLVRGNGGYLPVDIKNHRAIKKAKTLAAVVAGGGSPAERQSVTGWSSRAPHWHDDAMQLAHYARMLQDLELDTGEKVGGVIGAGDLSDLVGQSLGVVWVDLAAPGSGGAESVLDTYDREFALRLRIAKAAQGGGELVRPLHTAECANCAWLDYCQKAAPAGDASFAIESGLLDRSEWRVLYGAGRLSVSELATADPEQAVAGLQAAASRRSAERRLSHVIRRARMTVDGRDLEPLEGAAWPEPPSADIEVDFDIEWDTDDRIYQWGLRIRDGQDEATARYEPAVSFDPMDDQGELNLAEMFADRLEVLIGTAEKAGKSLAVYHWSNPETSRTARFPRVASALSGRTVDLLPWIRKRVFARAGFSIKRVAPIFGFHWGVDDPGGLASQTYIDLARAGDPEARAWCLRYNESDVAAQAAIRDGLRRLRAAG